MGHLDGYRGFEHLPRGCGLDGFASLDALPAIRTASVSHVFRPAGSSCLYRPWRPDIAIKNGPLEKMLCHMHIQILKLFPEIAVCMTPLVIRAASAFRFAPPAGSSCVNALGAQEFGWIDDHLKKNLDNLTSDRGILHPLIDVPRFGFASDVSDAKIVYHNIWTR